MSIDIWVLLKNSCRNFVMFFLNVRFQNNLNSIDTPYKNLQDFEICNSIEKHKT